MTALIVIAIIAAVLIVIALIPIRCQMYFHYDNKIKHSLIVKYGFIKLFSADNKTKSKQKKKEKKKKPEKDKKTKPDKKDKEKDKKKNSILLHFLWDNRYHIKEAIYAILGYLFKKLVRIKRLNIKLIIGTDDAMQTGLIFGSVSAFVFSTLGVIDHKMKLDEHNTDLKPDFDNPHLAAEIDSEIRTNIYRITAVAFIALFHAVPLYLRFRKESKNGKSD